MAGWHVLLIGGSSGSGKSELADEVAQRTGARVADLDDLLAAIRAVADPGSPFCANLDADFGSHLDVDADAVADAQLERCIELAHLLRPAIDAVVATHLDAGPRVILEGDFVLPVARVHPAVAQLVVYESGEAQLLANYRAREPHRGDQVTRAGVSRRYGEWLRGQALANGVDCVPSRPWASLAQRALLSQHRPH